MNRILLVSLFATTIMPEVHGQGYLIWNNVDPVLAPVTIRSFVGTFNPLDGPAGAYVGSNYSASLFFLNGVVTNQAEFDAGNPIIVPSADTYFLGTTGTGPGHGPLGDGSGFFVGGRVLVPASGSQVTVQVRAWYNGGGIYQSFAQAFAAGHNVGESNPFQMFLTFPPSAIQELAGLQSFTVGIPEPSTFVLAALGGVALLLFRRHK